MIKSKAGKKAKDKKEARRAAVPLLFFFSVGVVLSSLLLLTWYSLVFEPNNARFERHNLPIPNLPPEMKGKKLIQVSDTHCLGSRRKNLFVKAFEKINQEQPDIIVFTGDYFFGGKKNADLFFENSKKLKAGMGKIAILGNHDRWESEESMRKGFSDAGFRLLINGRASFGKDKPLYIIGIDDLWTGRPDIAASLGNADPKRDAVILLSHNPDIFPQAADMGIPVTLSGHTHGGQVVLPVIGAPVLPSDLGYRSGFYRDGDSILYVNRGLGLVSPPVRFLCPAEVTVFTLTAKE